MKSRIKFHEGWARAIAIVMIIGGIVVPVTSVLGATQPRDNDSNSIMWGGCYSMSECLTKINNGDGHHTSANLKQIYFNENRGITTTNFTAGTMVEGSVTKDGKVIVNGVTVATGAQSIGRNYINGSHKSGSVWERPTSVSFLSASIPAYVNMQGGVFHFAVIKSCGNAVRANAVVFTPPKSPSPSKSVTPSPSKSPSPSPSPSKSASPSPSKSVSPSPSKSPTQSPSPSASPAVLGATLPETGPEAALGGVAGLTAIGLASRAYLRSRKSLVDSLRNKR